MNYELFTIKGRFYLNNQNDESVIRNASEDDIKGFLTGIGYTMLEALYIVRNAVINNKSQYIKL